MAKNTIKDLMEEAEHVCGGLDIKTDVMTAQGRVVVVEWARPNRWLAMVPRLAIGPDLVTALRNAIVLEKDIQEANAATEIKPRFDSDS